MGGQFELELIEEKLQLGFGLGVAGKQQLAAIGGWQMQVDHLYRGELLEHAARGQPRRQGVQAPGERHVQAIGQKGDEDVGLDARRELVKDRPDGEIAFEVLEDLFDGDQQQIVAPQLGRVLLDQVGGRYRPSRERARRSFWRSRRYLSVALSAVTSTMTRRQALRY